METSESSAQVLRASGSDKDNASTRVPSALLDEKADATAGVGPPEDANEYPHGFRLWIIVLALILAIFLASLDMTIVATAIPKITDEFHGIDKVSWYGSAFFMTNGSFQSSWGKGYRYFPLKTTFLLSIITLEVGSLICGVAQDSVTLIVGRAITGLGASGIGTGAYTIIAFVAEPRKRAMFTGFVGLSFGIASVLGPLIGGVFSDKVSWRWCFYINLPIGGLSAFIILFFFRTPSTASPVPATWREKLLQMDFGGVALIMGAIVCYMLALQNAGQSVPWNDKQTIGLLVGFVVIVIVFIVWEHFQRERAMIVPRLFVQRRVWISCAYAALFPGSYYLVLYYLPIYFQSVHGTSPAMSGVNNIALIIALTAAMILSGMFISATGIAVPVQVIGAAIGVVASGLLYTLDLHTSTGKEVGYQILGGLGWGMSFQIPIIASQSGAEPADLSTLTAMVLFFQNAGGMSLITAGQSAFVNTLLKNLPEGVDPAAVVATGATQIRSAFPADQVPGIVAAYMKGVQVALALSIGGTGLALIVSLFSRWTRLHASSAAAAAA